MNVTVIKTSYLIEGKKTSCKIEFSIKNGKHIFKIIDYTICKPEDTFDANFGIKIAQAKAERKMYKFMLKTANKYLQEATCGIEETNKFIDKAKHCIEHNTEYIKNLSNPIKIKENNENN